MQTTSFYACAHRLGISGRWLLIVCAFAGMAAAVHAQTATDEDLYWRALADRDASMVRQLLESGANPNTSIATAGGATSLHAAASNPNSAEPLQALIAAGGDCNATDDRGQTPLQAAAGQSPLPTDTMRLLVQCQSQATTAAADSTQPTEYIPPPAVPTVAAASPAFNTVVEPPLDWVAPTSRLIINGLAAFTLLKTLQQQDLSELSPAAETLLTATIARLLKINLSDSDDTTDFSFSQTMAKDLMQLAILLKASKGTSEETQIALHNVLPPSTPPAPQTPPDNTQTTVHIPPPVATPSPINTSATCAGKPEHAECWKEVANRPGCFVWDVGYFSDQTVSWSGQCSDGVVSGHGTASWPASKIGGFDGFERTGSYVDGKAHGHWVERWASGDVWEGPYVDHKRHGHWVVRLASGTVWEGSYVDGKTHGHWVVRWASGDVYEGPYVDGKKHGRWVERWADGGVGEGPYVDGKAHGHWVKRLADGDVYEGPYVDGKKHGHWVERITDWSVKEGPYVDGEKHGRWVVRWFDGTVVEGPYVDGKRHGRWVERITDGGVSEGSYVDGKKHGHWVQRTADGSVGGGLYVDGKAHGHWVQRWADGGVDEGSYVDDKKHGRWVERDADGGVSEGSYVNGKEHGHWVYRTDGDVSEGSYVDGQRHGHWVSRWTNGSCSTEQLNHGVTVSESEC